MNARGPAVLIMARAPRAGEVRRALEPLLGREGCLELQANLIAHAAAWSRKIGAGAPHVAHDPPDSGGELRRLVGVDAILFPQNGEGITGRLADASARVLARSGGPLLIVWPDLPRFRVAHASGALEDLSSGADVVLGPAVDGGLYLVGIARPLPELFALPEHAWRNDVMAVAGAAIRDVGFEVGILRAERALHRPADVRAALADPLLPDDVAAILRRRL
jgi:glycosyltransferase A (GT-A) superfamily protein (DUF2064 family)